MTGPDDNFDELERFIDKTLRALPQRQAPRTLESRVFAEITRRAALPWWRKHFAQWPFAARLGFLLACFGSVKLAFVVVMWVSARADAFRFLSSPPAWIHGLGHVMSSMANLFVLLVGLIPSGLLYSLMALCLLLYGTLLALGAVGYHILYVDPSTRGLSQR